MKAKILVLCFVVLISYVNADMYLHNPRGSNNRLNEANTNRNNNNRMCNTQNNAKGGYAYGPRMYYYAGSYVPIEWTNQHGCGDNANVFCEIVIQYMCGDEVRDGTVTDTIPDDVNAFNTVVDNPDPELYIGNTNPNIPNQDGNKKVYKFGMHESYQYYQDCKARQRNKGLFIADQNVGQAAINTRQNPGGGRSGFECPEERDYYPYWHPTPWKDIAILTDDLGRCDYYRSETENDQGRNYCELPKFNNYADCHAAGSQWHEADDHGGSIDCDSPPYSRDNHLGNGVQHEKGQAGIATYYWWTVPDDENDNCVLRMRYNVSSGDYDGWDVTSNSNGKDKSPVVNDPTITFGGTNLTLAIDTSQFGRTFQDRSYTFSIRSRGSIGDLDRIWNLNVRGKRGNIVQVYPAVEYDYVPNHLELHEHDRVHFQWTGSKFNPQGNDGEGTRGTDVSNLIVMDGKSMNTFLGQGDDKHFLGESDAYYFAHLNQQNCSTYEQLVAKHGNNQDDIDRDPANCQKLNSASQYFDGGLFKFNEGAKEYKYMSTRNNNFTNRSQKGSITVIPFLPIWAIVLVVFSGVVCIAAAVLGIFGVLGRFMPESVFGQAWSKATVF
eukprot:TRINITY_DN5849_c0_g1_i3.p1 TRINITY_DN5849_c0_g1~~TRINITY_DN5849_c0_g1_i3.p1  ORF type:complete len:608 (-),score=129.53 TRINITY_DN5849_c0_g1_i3:76-1899(-)